MMMAESIHGRGTLLLLHVQLLLRCATGELSPDSCIALAPRDEATWRALPYAAPRA